MRLTDYRTVVFDLDDTLYLERDYVFSGFQAVGDFLHRAQHWPADACQEFVRTCVRFFQAGNRGDTFDRALDAQSKSLSRPRVRDLVRAYRTHWPSIDLCPDADRLLDELSMHQNVWINTDGHLMSQCAKLASLRLSARIQQAVCTDRWGRAFWKPHARSFEWVQRLTRAAPQSCVYLADNPFKDFQAPRRLGWSTVRIRRCGGVHTDQPAMAGPADLELDSFWPFCGAA
jgi:putative hydrolase of the HAD superfamily